MTILKIRISTRYVALSYVWGTTARVQLNKKDLKPEEIAVQDFPFCFSALPQTFKDAIELTKLIDEKYIWIDALCIMQDDIEQRNTIKAMDKIYKKPC